MQLYAALFNWTPAEATDYIQKTLIAPPKPPRKNAAPKAEPEIVLKPGQKLCPITNTIARYRDPETGIAYRDARAFGVLRGVVGGGFVWSGDLGCYVGGRARPLESMGGKGFLGMPPAKNVPRRFWEMSSPSRKVMAPPPPTPTPATKLQTPVQEQVQSVEQSTPVGQTHGDTIVVATPSVGGKQSSAPVKAESATGS